jgi:hypothetical protein
MQLDITVERIRLLMSAGNVKQASTTEAKAFMTLYEDKLKEALECRLKEFVREKVS